MAAENVGGAFLGAVFGEVLKVVTDATRKAYMFKSELEDLKSTLESIMPTLQEIQKLNEVLDIPGRETAKLRKEMIKGEKLVRKSSKVKRCNCFNRVYYAEKIIKLKKSIETFCKVNMQTQMARDNKKILVGMNSIKEMLSVNEKCVGVSNRVEIVGPCSVPDSLASTPGLDVPMKELRTELLKDDGMQVIVVSAPGGAGKTTLIKKLCADDQVKEVQVQLAQLQDFGHIKMLRVCKGSPLALTVVGRLLCGKPAAVWQSTVKEWDRGKSIFISGTELLVCLQSSLDALDEEVKECYLDLGSFPQDQRIPITALIDMWTELHEWVEDGLSAITYLHKLSDRCLVNLVLQDETFSSRWYELKAPEVEVVVLNLRTNKYTLPNFMGNMGKLKVVIVSNYGFLPAELNNFSLLGSDTVSNLKRIRLEHVSIPSFGVQMNNLQKISLVMCNVGQAFRNSNFQISEAFPNLLEFEIDDCNDLEKLPDGLCDIVSLKKLNIINCHKLSALPEEIGKLVKLEELRLVSCTELSELPEMVSELSNLKLLDISDCLSITKLSTQVGKLRSLVTLCMRGCSSCRLPASIMKLERLNVVKCDEVTASQWETYKPYLPRLKVEVLKDDINLKWPRKLHF
ncbi:hypothetical protein LWI29_030402 [Acer saccharum]|uniref:RPW8 domain-containing protein n=1 Tax=Acer saccharum TaxID=4024 RepID=A0AA39TAN1_ACESA|nr:hypothetical protein LWI29_030402 [Acer saccharum]